MGMPSMVAQALKMESTSIDTYLSRNRYPQAGSVYDPGRTMVNTKPARFTDFFSSQVHNILGIPYCRYAVEHLFLDCHRFFVNQFSHTKQKMANPFICLFALTLIRNFFVSRRRKQQRHNKPAPSSNCADSILFATRREYVRPSISEIVLRAPETLEAFQNGCYAQNHVIIGHI